MRKQPHRKLAYCPLFSWPSFSLSESDCVAVVTFTDAASTNALFSLPSLAYRNLRVYYDMGNVGDDVHQAIAEARKLAEARSFRTCEHCGKRGWLAAMEFCRYSMQALRY